MSVCVLISIVMIESPRPSSFEIETNRVPCTVVLIGIIPLTSRKNKDAMIRVVEMTFSSPSSQARRVKSSLFYFFGIEGRIHRRKEEEMNFWKFLPSFSFLFFLHVRIPSCS